MPHQRHSANKGYDLEVGPPLVPTRASPFSRPHMLGHWLSIVLEVQGR